MNEPDEDVTPFPDAVELPITDEIDLHGFAPKEMREVVNEYLHEAARRGFREVRVVHGKGKGVQRQNIQSLLARHPLVERFRDAPADMGGLGATQVWLKTD